MGNLRKTEYFYSKTFDSSQVPNSIADVKAKRDAFLTENSSKIDEIVHESIDFTHVGSGAYLFAIITLSYFEKK